MNMLHLVICDFLGKEIIKKNNWSDRLDIIIEERWQWEACSGASLGFHK